MKSILVSLILIVTLVMPAMGSAHPSPINHTHVKKRVLVKKRRPARRRVVVHQPSTTTVVVTPRPRRRVLAHEETTEVSPLSIGIRATGLGVEGLKLHLSDLENPAMGGVGIQLRSRIDENWGLELASDFLTGGTDDFQQNQLPITLSALFYFFPESSIQPYMLAGAGIQFTELEYFNGAFSYSLTEAVGQIGLGVDLKVSDRISINGDFRALGVFTNLGERADAQASCISSMPGAGGLCGSGTMPDEKFNAGIQFLAGVSYTF